MAPFHRTIHNKPAKKKCQKCIFVVIIKNKIKRNYHD